MTHDELLDYLEEHKEYWTSLRAQKWVLFPAFNALKAVIERHEGVLSTGGTSKGRVRCTECGFAYPCPTIIDIETKLKEQTVKDWG